MTTDDLRELFLLEHKRDQRLTFISFALLVAAIIGIFGFLFYIGIDFTKLLSSFTDSSADNKYAWWPKAMMGLMLVIGICYPFYRIWKVSKRPQEIEELLSRVLGSSKATTFQEDVDYKIIIPLGKVTFKLCPITIIRIFLDSDPKAYILPIRKVYIPDMKLVLSGANMGKLNEIRDALYSNSDLVEGGDSGISQTSEEDNTLTPIKTVAEFKSFIASDLQSTLDEMETDRKSTRKIMYIFGSISALIAFGWVGYTMYGSFSKSSEGDYSATDPMSIIFPFVGVMAVMYVIYFLFSKPKQNSKGGINSMNYMTPGDTFKEKVLTKMVKFINPNVEYMKLGHIGLPEFLESGLFDEKNYDIDGNDQIVGRHSGVPFIMCDLSVSLKRNWSKENEAPDSAFMGQFFVARFNKKFNTPVYIKPKTGIKGFFTGNDISSYTTTYGDKVSLEDPEFSQLFEVYATDQITARYILTPALMERIKELAKRTKGQYYIAFNNNKITVANNNQKNNFEVGMNTSLTKNDSEVLVNFYQDLCDQFAIVDELKLNVKIWG